MQLTSKQSFLFKAEGKDDFVLSNSETVIVAPDWIKSTPLYDLAVQDGLITEYTQVTGEGPKPVKKAPKVEPDKQLPLAEAAKADPK
jgi:hypothetical protein